MARETWHPWQPLTTFNVKRKLQKISDFIKSELQFMLKNRQQSQTFSGGFAPWTPNGRCLWTLLGAGAPRLAPSTSLRAAPIAKFKLQ